MKESELQSLIRRSARKPSPNPFFTRKVMNRLPEPQRQPGQWLIDIAIAIGALILGFYWYAFVKEGHLAELFTQVTFYALTATTIAVATATAYRIVTRD